MRLELTFLSISSIATAELAILTTAMGDEKSAKQLQTAAKSTLKEPSKKRGASEALPSETKRRRSQFELAQEPQTPDELEASLALPKSAADEDEISKTVLFTNRAPLVLAFAVVLLKYTMPEQPPSSRLSLAQAVVSMNSKSKAVSIGISSGNTAEQEGWGHGQPKVRVMGREIYVLKRGGYEWKGSNKDDTNSNLEQSQIKAEENLTQSTLDLENPQKAERTKSEESKWSISKSVTLKKSTFIARSIGISSPLEARSSLRALMASSPELRDASHNITAWRALGDHGVIEECNDDGESGGGRHLLGLLQSSNLVGVLLVVTRWYGGIFLSTDRWRLMSEVARDALSQRLRVTGSVGGEALWGLDLEAMKTSNAPVTGGTSGGMPIHKPEPARSYIMKAFASAPVEGETSTKKKTGVALERQKESNLGSLLSALDTLFRSWVEHISRDELDRRAWSWYMQTRPQVESGAAGWGGKGEVKLADILALRRNP